MRVGVVGASGRMGREIVRAVSDAGDLDLAAEIGSDDPLDRLTDADVEVAVDVTTPDAVAHNVRWCLGRGVHVVVGTTGWSDGDLAAWGALSRDTGANAVVAPNFAIGAVLMMSVAQQVARHLTDAEIVELHHERKLDAPSGTARRTAQLIRGARGDGRDVPIHSVRLPGLVAHQEVIFGGQGETLTIRHDTIDRTAFMPGVLLAIREVRDHRGVTVGLERILGLDAGEEQAP